MQRSATSCGMEITAFSRAQRYMGIREIKNGDHPLIQWWLSLCRLGFDAEDETPWCSAFVNGVCWDLRLPRTYSARARSWLFIGETIPIQEARVGFDVVILQRGLGDQPGPEVLDAPGHVMFYGGQQPGFVSGVGGNQNNEVNVRTYPISRVLGVRRLA